MTAKPERLSASGPIVRGFSQGKFSVDGEIYAALILTPDRAIAWNPPALGQLGIDDLADVLSLDPRPEFLIIGTGSNMAFPPRPLVRALEAQGIGVEAMDSRAAARTWGMLRTEERWIAAAIMGLD